MTPAFGGGTAQTLKEYNGLVTTTTNAKDQARIETRNINGQLVSVTDAKNKTITYGYDADGSFETSTDSKGNVITSTFDNVGHKIQVNDPDKGNWRYYYNALGEVRREVNGNGQEKWLSYDALGRTVTRIDDALGNQKQTTQSVYDNQFLGALDSQTLSSKDGSLIQFKQQSYDSYGRPTVTTTKNVGEQTLEHYNRTYYDGIGRAVINQSSKAFATLTEFNSLGFPFLVKRADNDSELQRIITMNRRGKATEVKYLGSRTQIHGYDKGTGLKSSSSTDNVASQTFTFDALGNLLTRNSSFDDNNDGVFDSTTAEVFDYDNLNRLNWHNINGSRYQSFCYDELGNLTHKNNGDVACTTAATHKYNGTKPHAVSEFGGRTFSYDNNGNLTNDQQRTISYSPFDKPTEISKNGQSVKFNYGANRARFERIDSIAANHKVVTHSLGAFERIVTNKDNVTTTQENHYVGSLIINKKVESSDEATCLMVKDHLGSLVARLNGNGTLQKRYRFDAFGQQHEIDGASILPVTSRTDITQKGFTGHEMVGSMDIIHMNGRIYDPIIGRFLQADPHVQAPKNMQNMNRYSYVLNNPLSHTDPSGFIFKKLGRLHRNLLRAIAKVPLLNLIAQASACTVGGPVGCTTYAMASTYAVTGSFKSAAIAGFFSAVMPQGGGFLDSAIIGGLSAKAQGGKFGHGFWSAGIGGAIGGRIDVGNAYANVIVSAVIGGTLSKLTGGKFTNGAQTWAFKSAIKQNFTGESDNLSQKDSKESLIDKAERLTEEQRAENLDKNKIAFKAALDAIQEKTGNSVPALKIVDALEINAEGKAFAAIECGLIMGCSEEILVAKQYLETETDIFHILDTAYHEYLHYSDGRSYFFHKKAGLFESRHAEIDDEADLVGRGIKDYKNMIYYNINSHYEQLYNERVAH